MRSLRRGRPDDIPSAPYRTYTNDGWVNWADWLGNDWLGKQKIRRPFAEARTFVRGLNLSTVSEWQRYTRSKNFPADIPKDPRRGYAADEWVDWGDWLGTGISRNWRAKKRPFREARAFVRSLGLKNWREFARSERRPKDIPSTPDVAYANEGWAGFEDWMGMKKNSYLPFTAARKFVRSLQLATQRDWQRYCKSRPLPSDIPRDPRRVYAKDGWISFPDWLGTARPES